MPTDSAQEEFKVWVGAGFHRVRAANVIEAASSVLTDGLRAKEIFKVERSETSEIARAAVLAQKEKDAEKDPMEIPCPSPRCGKPIGEPCYRTDPREYTWFCHDSRWRAAIRSTD